MRNLVLGSFLLFGLLFGIATADVAAGEIEDLRAEITKLLVQMKSLEAGPDEVIVERLEQVPEFEHVAVGWDGEYPEGNFVYYRPIIWESVGGNNYYGLYDHRLEVLHLENAVENVTIILDDKLIIVTEREGLQVRSIDPVADILSMSGTFNVVHSRSTNVIVDPHNVRGHIISRGFSGEFNGREGRFPHGFYPKTGHDLIIKVGDTLVGIIFPMERKMERHRQVRLMMLGDGAVSLHGYPENEVVQGFRYEDVRSFADIAHTSTEALGYLVTSEIIRDLTLLVHEAMKSTARGLGAPAAHQGPVQSLLQRTQSMLSGAVAPESKKLTTWGELKR